MPFYLPSTTARMPGALSGHVAHEDPIAPRASFRAMVSMFQSSTPVVYLMILVLLAAMAVAIVTGQLDSVPQ